MKHIIAAIALVIVTMSAHAQTLDPRTQEYRMWSAEQMIERLAVRLGRMQAACKQAETYFPKVSETCKESVMSVYPQLRTVRQIAAEGDDVLWAKVIDVVHKLETDTEPHLQTLGK